MKHPKEIEEAKERIKAWLLPKSLMDLFAPESIHEYDKLRIRNLSVYVECCEDNWWELVITWEQSYSGGIAQVNATMYRDATTGQSGFEIWDVSLISTRRTL